MLCHSKFHFRPQLCGEEHQCTISSFPFFLKKDRPKKQKNNQIITNKIEAINILGL